MKKLSILNILRQLYLNLSRKRKLEIAYLLFFVVIAVFSETLSLASAFPFLQIIVNPKIVWDNYFINYFLTFWGYTSDDNLTFIFCFIFGSTALFAAIAKSYYLWISGVIASRISTDLSYACFKQNLYQSYDSFLDNKSSELITNNAVYISQANEIISNIARLFSNFLIAISISIYLIFLNPFLAIISIFTFLVVYIFLGKFLQKQLINNSKVIDKNSKYQVQIMQEAMGTFRDILLDTNQKYFLKIFKDIDRKVRSKSARNVFFNLFPRYAIEGLFLIILSILTFTISLKDRNFVDLIAVLGTFAIGAQKLLPCMQQTYGTWSFIVGSKSSLLSILKLSESKYEKNYFSYIPKPIKFSKSIEFKNIYYKYPGTNKYVLKNLNLKIFKGEKVGIVGKTGSGKSTLLDIFMSLLEPSSGNLLLDGKKIFDKRYPYRKLDWRKSIAHVPQNIFLNNTTIAENIALGYSLDEIDISKVKKAAKEANIEEYILKQPNNFFSLVGENGIKISGGQKQRIGLARALYKKLDIMVLDEATSALDFITEKKIMDSLFKLNPDLTVLVITHRENSIKSCSKVIEISENGVVLRQKI